MWTLAEKTLPLRGRRSLMPALYLLPAYWLLMGVACLLALVELAFKPHHWSKTPHVGARSQDQGDGGHPAPHAGGRAERRRSAGANPARLAIGAAEDLHQLGDLAAAASSGSPLRMASSTQCAT